MGFVRDRLAALEVRVASSDKTIEMRLTRAGGISISIDDDVAEYHSDESFGEEIDETFLALMKGYRQAVDQIEVDARGGPPTRDLSKTSAGIKRALFEEKAEDIEVQAESPRRFVTINWTGYDEIVTVLKPGTLNKLRGSDLAAEIQQATAEAANERSIQLRKLHRTIYRRDKLAA